jgi:putative membrane protein
VPLVAHGPAARRRRYARALVTTSLLPLALLLLWWVADWPLWLAAVGLLAPWGGARLAADRYAGLGHALTEHYVVVRAGSFQGRRDALQRSGIIGWNVRQTFFQRRAGLCTLSATTAAGKQVYHALDIPESDAVALADAAVPGLVSQFVE